MELAFSGADEMRPLDDRVPEVDGSYIEVQLVPEKDPGSLERGPRVPTDGSPDQKIRPGATHLESNGGKSVALFVPDSQRAVLEEILSEYTTGDLTEKGNPPNNAYVSGIESIRQARLETFWTDDIARLPSSPNLAFWWEVWCYRTRVQRFEAIAQAVGAVVANRDQWLTFPESVVVPVRTTRVTIELLLFAASGIAELRQASATPTFFVEATPDEQRAWTEELAGRVVWPGTQAPAVCLLDTGVNRGHILLEPALAPSDLDTVNAAWGASDSEGHGTEMAGIALLGDLTLALQDMAPVRLAHRLESVKVIAPQGTSQVDLKSYGPITQAAVSLPEINSPERARVYCMAITNDGVSGARPSTWSAALDQAAAGTMSGEDDGPKRLLVVAAGNAPSPIEMSRVRSIEEYPIEDPGQSWNALTVGGVTEKIRIDDEGYEAWSPMVNAGEPSPFTRTSVTWPSGRAPFKPDVVFEAGNRGVRPDGTEALDLESLGVLTTGADVDRSPLVPFRATSAATAEASRLAARLMADHPDLWPETHRALIVHSAEWTDAMRARLDQAHGVRERYDLLRIFGYGVPSFERASRSAQNDLAIVSEQVIQPFKSQGRRFRDCHYYPLPWPREILEELDNHFVRLRVTLSYFVDPNPGASASIYPMRYQSFGLRFDLRRNRETVDSFKQRVNAAEREDPTRSMASQSDDGRWMFGPRAVSAGSLHCDEWNGPAIELAGRNIICVKPVGGWWRDRASPAVANQRGRYALVVTLSAPDTEVDLHTPIATAIEAGIGIEVPI
ncbi:S8 family peptidase [Nisaea nitritireducens]|uniref:S8 family peptidase n=1 Tax=Nisaea nitritireducens TaxID=568392 RepID=UPI001D00A7E3|nr:S8 family peptidase [Nisaea nitritireducens]